MAPKQMGHAQRERAGAGVLALGTMLCAAVRAFVPVSSTVTQAARAVGASGQSAGTAKGQQQSTPTSSFQAAFLGISALVPLTALALGSRYARDRRGSGRAVLCARGGSAEAPLVVIAGPPAAGKGTQCEKIKEKYGFVHISTGDMLRENVKNGTELGKKAEGYMKAGALVPSELIVDIVKDRLAQDDVKAKGCLLDGFPRAPDQAQAMVDAGLKIEKFILIEVPDDDLVVRGCGRRLDPETGDIYHMKFKPPPAEIMDRLVHRSDDQEEAIRNRLKIYHDQVNGIVPFFKEVVSKIDGTGKPDEVFGLVGGSLDSLRDPAAAC